MTDSTPGTDEVTRSRKSLYTALAVLVLMGALAGVFVAVGGIDMVADLIAGETDSGDIIAPVPPAEPGESAAGEPGESTEPDGSAEPTETAEPGETAGGSTTGGTSGTSGTPGTSATTPVAKPPTGDQQARMYAEQAASQEQIGKLVRGEITSFNLGAVTRSGSTASVRVTANYAAGGSMSGTMVLRDYNGVWYFSSITRDGNSGSTPSAPGDSGVISAIISAQAANQEIPAGIVSGGYKTLTVNGASSGSGTASVRISLSGGTSPRTAGTITCVSKDIGGVKYWFITSFTKN
ncbi:MAG: hypothetical protein Q7W44_03975 [Coriobacteriia bacterium]|nr:hypothetical protein [Coriobacteriia bacterium]